ncbi:MAG: FecR domain-containing protein [Planctomycetes bacterium]|nr:FecR domain-containing protein [Planctomycetota bacterium]MBL7143038.1 FecR domain-containing protein [Phycisphaerae bacterium]
MNCEKYTELIEKYLIADIEEAELDRLKDHIRQCESCGKKFEEIGRLEEFVKSSFSSATTAKQASESIMSKLPETRAASAPVILFSKQMAVAASIFLAVGLLSGFVLGKFNADKRTEVPTAAKVPMKVARLEGTVLVKHRDSELWHPMQPDSDIYLGDKFHSAPKSALVLELENQSTLELNQNSILVLKLYNGETQFYLEYGKLAAALESPHPPFFVSTPHGRVEALGTEFTVNVE